MSHASGNRPDSFWWIACLAVLVIPRLLYLDADFPMGITWSGTLYTDEGGYLNGAVRHMLTGRWYLPGDYNPMVTLPVGPLLQALAFHTLGLSLVTARLTVALASILMIFFVDALVRRQIGTPAARIATALLALNFFFFAYSRLALLELLALCFSVMAIATALLPTTIPRRAALVFAALLLALGVLTKTTALCALPPLLAAAWWQGQSRRESAEFVLIAGGGLGLILAAYTLAAMTLYPADYQYFLEQNILRRAQLTLMERLQIGLGVIQAVRVIDPIAYPLAVLTSLYCLVFDPSFRKNRLVWLCLLWYVSSLAMLCFMGYHPPRYFLPFLVPVFILFGAALSSLFRQTRGRVLIAVPVLLLLTVFAYNGLRLVQYFGALEYSYVRMATNVRSIIEEETGNAGGACLLGNISDTVSLATGIPSVNSELGTWTLEQRIKTYRPGYYIALGPENGIAQTLEQWYQLKSMGQWDVFGNYYQGKKVYLYKLVQKPGEG